MTIETIGLIIALSVALSAILYSTYEIMQDSS